MQCHAASRSHVERRETADPGVRHGEAGVGHAEGLEYPRREILVERHSGNDFDEFELARARDAAMDSDPARQMSEDELDAKLLQRFSYLADETNS